MSAPQTSQSPTSQDEGRQAGNDGEHRGGTTAAAADGSRSSSPTATPDYLDRLPTELRWVVLSHIDALTDRKALNRVNKAWYKLTLPSMWETFTTDAIQRGGRHFSDLSPPMNIIKHILNINLLHRTIAGNIDCLHMLLQIIPSGQLQTFKSADPIQLSILQTLLWAHRKLVKLKVPTNSALCTVLQSKFTLGCFRHLTSVIVDVEKFSCDGLRRLWNECSNLTHISLL
jgi:hypothetical protein